MILRAKLAVPPAWPGALERARLEAWLDAAVGAGQHIALVAASGYGKTAVLADWARKRQTAWVSLDAEDADPESFLRYVIAALESAMPGFASEASGMLDRAREREGALAALSALLADLEEQASTPVALVLDDYHLAASPTLDDLLGRLLKYLPAPVRLVVASRVAPAVELSALVSRRQLVRAGEPELAFDRAELRRLQPEASEAELERLLESSGGWPAGMGMAPDLLDAYLDEQMLLGVEASHRALLLRLALVDSFEPAFCEEALGVPFSAETRDALLRARLALSPAPGAYTVPQPLRGWLRRRFAAEVPANERRTVLYAIGRYLWARGQGAVALRFWIDAKETDWAAEQLEQAWEEWLAAGRLDVLASALAALGASAERPALRLAAGEVHRRRGDFDRAAVDYDAALAGFEAAGEAALAARARLGQALAAASCGQVERARTLLDAARADLGEDPRRAIDVLNLEGGLALFSGETEAARGHFEASLRSARRSGDAFAEGRALHNLGVCATRLGAFDRALESYDAALGAAGGTPAVWMTPINRALVLVHLGRAEEAHAAAASALALVRRYQLTREEGYCLRILGFAALKLGRLEEAARGFAAAELLARRMNDQLGIAYSLNFQAELAIRQGDAAGALARVAEVEALVGGPEAVAGFPDLVQVRAKAHLAAGQREAAQPFLERLTAIAGEPAHRHLLAELEPAPLAVAPAPLAPELTVRCFGGWRAWRGEAEIGEKEWQSLRAKWLLAFLLHVPEGASKGRLEEALFPEGEPSEATLYMNLTRLRKALEPTLGKGQPSRFVLRQDGLYAFNWQLALDLDTQAFEHACRSARKAATPEAEIAHWRAALTRYRGEFLPGVELEWAVFLRNRYKDQAVGACRRLLELVPEHEALEVVYRALEIDPLSEEFNRELILRFLEADEPHRALEHYRLCAQRYAEALEMAPPEDLTALVAELAP